MNKIEAWKKATEFVDPIVEKHGLQDVREGQVIFTTGFVSTKVNQHINHIMDVANWLLDEVEID